jgi:copper oxidase (laccase) domain-containing protein
VVVVPSEAPRGAGGTESGRVRAVLAGYGDALVSSGGRIGLVILTADCASVALGSPEGVLGAVHAGWRGLADGVVEQAVETMGTLGATEVVGAVGPCIHPGCYEFSESDLDRVAARLGDGARSRTASGRPDACTGCAGGYFSHRARGDGGRQALLVWTSAVDR